MTDALSSFGVLLKRGDGGDPENFAMIAELRATNAKLDQLYELVASGQVRVRLAG